MNNTRMEIESWRLPARSANVSTRVNCTEVRLTARLSDTRQAGWYDYRLTEIQQLNPNDDAVVIVTITRSDCNRWCDQSIAPWEHRLRKFTRITRWILRPKPAKFHHQLVDDQRSRFHSTWDFHEEMNMQNSPLKTSWNSTCNTPWIFHANKCQFYDSNSMETPRDSMETPCVFQGFVRVHP